MSTLRTTCEQITYSLGITTFQMAVCFGCSDGCSTTQFYLPAVVSLLNVTDSHVNPSPYSLHQGLSGGRIQPYPCPLCTTTVFLRCDQRECRGLDKAELQHAVPSCNLLMKWECTTLQSMFCRCLGSSVSQMLVSNR